MERDLKEVLVINYTPISKHIDIYIFYETYFRHFSTGN